DEPAVMDSHNEALDNAVVEAIDDAAHVIDRAFENTDRVPASTENVDPPPDYTASKGTMAHTSNQLPSQSVNMQSFDLEEAKPQSHSNGPMERLKRRANRLSDGFRPTGPALWFIIIVIICCIPDALYVVYAYYYNYAEIYFNSTIALNIFRNSNTENAFKAFFYILSLLCIIPNAVAGWGFAMLGWWIV